MLFDFATVEDCAATVSGIIASGVVPAAVEMMDRGIVVAAEGFAHAGYPTDAAAILIVEVDGTGRPPSKRSRRRSRRRPARTDTRDVRVAEDEAERALIWKGRKNAFGAVATIAPHYHLHDCVVPGPGSSRCSPASTRSPRGTSSSSRTCSTPATATCTRSSRSTVRARDARTRPARERGDRRPVRRRGRGALGRARDRAREARLHAARVLRRGPLGAGVRSVGVRPRGADEPAEGAARRGPVRRLRDGARLGRRGRAADLPEGSWI